VAGAEPCHGGRWPDDHIIGAAPVSGGAAAPPVRGAAAHGRRPTVLVVDDEPPVRSLLRRYLDDGGYVVCEAGDIDSALSALDESAIDAVVLDIRMPDPMGWGRSGLEVLAFIRLHAAFAALPVLILTGHPLDPDEQNLVARQKAHVFLKPEGYRLPPAAPAARRADGTARHQRSVIRDSPCTTTDATSSAPPAYWPAEPFSVATRPRRRPGSPRSRLPRRPRLPAPRQRARAASG
jgi:CheY-like chemotaxis protein